MERMKRVLLTEDQVRTFTGGSADRKFDMSMLPEPYILRGPGSSDVPLYPIGDVLAAIARQGFGRLKEGGLLPRVGYGTEPEDIFG